MTDRIIRTLAEKVIHRAGAEGMTLATAESCTGGLISGALTDVPGASAVFTHGFVTYANEAKAEILGVPQETLDRFGAVSSQTARAMAEGALRVAHADITVAVTGIAGPGGGTPDKPVGLVYISLADHHGVLVHRHTFPSLSREFIRYQTVKSAMRHVLARISA